MRCAMANAGESPLLQVRDLTISYRSRPMFSRRHASVTVANRVSFDITAGQAVALVGESGCGKSSTARAILQLQRAESGSVKFRGEDLCRLRGERLRTMRRNIQMVFQDPYTSMNPALTVFDVVAEPLRVHTQMRGDQLKRMVASLLSDVGLDPNTSSRYPRDFSGGQRQRIAIARAIAIRPALVVCDEPVSALDVSTQEQITQLLLDLKQRHGLSYLIISHDLASARRITDSVMVMYAGTIVEKGPTGAVLDNPMHPYTRALVSAVPTPDPFLERRRERLVLGGEVPSPANPPSGCRFHPRCPLAVPGSCDKNVPTLTAVSETRSLACDVLLDRHLSSRGDS